jgi:phage shock protein A
MFSFLKKLFVRIAGWFHIAGNDLVSSSPDAIRSTYAAAIQEAAEDYKSMQEGLALIMQQAARIKGLLDGFIKIEVQTHASLDGALELAAKDPANELHREAGSKYLVKLEELRGKIEQQTKDYDTLTKMVGEYKVKLASMRIQIEDLRREQAEKQVEFVAAQNTLRLEEKLQGISTRSAVDESIIAIREKIENMKAQVRVVTEMRGTEPTSDAYAEIGAEKQAAIKFDELLRARQTTSAQIEPGRLVPLLTKEPVKVRDLG